MSTELNSYEIARLEADIEKLTAALETCRELRIYDRKEIERLMADNDGLRLTLGRRGRKMNDITERFDNMVGHIVGINDERDVVPLLLGLKDMWPQLKSSGCKEDENA
jgi:hypothetical protein